MAEFQFKTLLETQEAMRALAKATFQEIVNRKTGNEPEHGDFSAEFSQALNAISMLSSRIRDGEARSLIRGLNYSAVTRVLNHDGTNRAEAQGLVEMTHTMEDAHERIGVLLRTIYDAAETRGGMT